MGDYKCVFVCVFARDGALGREQNNERKKAPFKEKAENILTSCCLQ